MVLTKTARSVNDHTYQVLPEINKSFENILTRHLKKSQKEIKIFICF